MAQAQKPSVGRIVHFVPRAKTPDHNNADVLPAIIVNIDKEEPDGVVNLQVFNDGYANFWERAVPYEAEGTTPATWHWPEIVK